MPSLPSAAERAAAAKAARKDVPRSAHGEWAASSDRADPVSIVTRQDETRLPWLVPVRHARMAESAFAFFRGGAAVMAADLAATPTMGSHAQLCGDAHLANFGTFASAERRQVFDVNDFDETLPGPWEWDVKRLAASLVIAARDNGFAESVGEDAARESVQAYANAMRQFAAAPILQTWYSQMSLEQIRAGLPSKGARQSFDKAATKARGKNSQRALGSLTDVVDGAVQIRRNPPLLIPLRDLSERLDHEQVRASVEADFRGYVESLPSSRRHVLGRFRIVDIAIKVVGVGSVGTRCWIVLLTGRDHGEPLFLQVKEATESVLEAHLPGSEYSHPGQRVVEGQRLMQTSGDMFLGWSGSSAGSDYYWRQFHDMKASANVAALSPDRLDNYGRVCGWTLAHAHARSGDAPAISGYLGSGRTFATALGRFAVAYADQNEADYAAFSAAIDAGQVEASEA